jgi:hypothetical protein
MSPSILTRSTRSQDPAAPRRPIDGKKRHASGNVFRIDDFELAHPVFGETRSADQAVREKWL